jgi:GTPase SAR1 family protein
MKEKFNSVAQEYLKILVCLESVDRETKMYSGHGDNYINDIKKTLSKLKQLNNKQSHTICIVGLEKAGKSTFINALLGYQLVPTAAERCTQVRTVLKPPLEDGDHQLFATVKFYDDEEFRTFYDQMVKKTDDSQQKLDERKREVIAAREALKVKFPEEHFRINNWNDVERERTAICEQLNDYITGEIYVNIIKEISIYTDKLPGM